jgi:hypothetical protein
MPEWLLWIAGIAAGLIAGTYGVYAVWRLRSLIKVWRAGEPPLQSVRAVIWRDPGAVETLDLAAGPGGRAGAPAPPFTFVEEHLTGSQPCMSVRDRRGRNWRVKWGNEVQVETLATRLAWAAGYFVEINYFVAEGRITGAADLQRAADCVGEGGHFKDARFELDEENVLKHFDEHSWAWNDNPFVGTRELNGLKVVMMWLSNWDAKDVRDVARGSNTAIFEYRLPGGVREARYLIIDWGGALGRWGSVVARGRWDCDGLSEQTPHLVQGIDGDVVRWGYTGQRTADMTEGIRRSDVEWLMGHLGRLREEQIADAIRASGGTPEEVACFTRALSERLDRLRDVPSLSPFATLPGLPTTAAS